jgi:DNA-binding MarR family transcriptional regulator
MEHPYDEFLIGSLVGITNEALAQRLDAFYPLEGFPEIRQTHSIVFRSLPPEGCRLSELAERCHSTRQAIGYLVTHLVEHGYLMRIPDPVDSRAQIIQRTERGWAFHKAIKPYVYQVQREWTVAFGEEKMEQMLGLLREFVHNVLEVKYEGSISELGTDTQKR